MELLKDLVPHVFAIAAGIAMVAYSKPRLFLRIVDPMMKSAFGFALVAVVWDFAHLTFVNASLPFIQDKQKSDFLEAMNNANMSWRIGLASGVTIVFLAIFKWLAEENVNHLEVDIPKDKMEDEKLD